MNIYISGATTSIGFIAKLFGKDAPPKAMVKFNGKLMFNELDPSFYYVRSTKPVEVIADSTDTNTNSSTTTSNNDDDDAISDLRDDLDDDDETEEEDLAGDGSNAPIPTQTPDEIVNELKINYKDAVRKSIFFYLAQRSGDLPDNFRITWRRDSAMFDKGTFNGTDVDLTGGYYDAGDNIKLAYPLAFSMTSLSWGLLHYWDAYIG